MGLRGLFLGLNEWSTLGLSILVSPEKVGGGQGYYRGEVGQQKQLRGFPFSIGEGWTSVSDCFG